MVYNVNIQPSMKNAIATYDQTAACVFSKLFTDILTFYQGKKYFNNLGATFQACLHENNTILIICFALNFMEMLGGSFFTFWGLIRPEPPCILFTAFYGGY